MPAHQAARGDLEELSDEDLLSAVENPANGDWLVINARTSLLYDGNGRANELLRRAGLTGASQRVRAGKHITPDTLVPVEYYTPDYSMFPDLD